MAWCPECRYEFVDGVKECPKCHVALVESLSAVTQKEEELSEAVLFEELTEEDEDREYSAEIDPEREDAIGLTDEEKARSQISRHGYVTVKPYQSKAQKAEDARSSGIAMVIVGACILVFSVLWAFDLLPIRMQIERRFLSCGILGAFSLFMLIMGVFSLRSFKKLLVFAQEEDRRTEEILKWGKSLETKAIDEPMEGLGLAEEEKYFGRMEIIGQLMKDRFVNLDPDYADDVCEKIYQELYDAAGKGE
ncbi:MAG: hypothetical protein IKQ27_05445 [Lachnospiraceae bacterium]|nr:hypothetical protein [Lachnospiraceae bacterium]MBR3734268.1 hypothetical protein [Lachnospiraceae bacterium]MBR6156384.1 hypothetical protein [Lachnospiraceae bacterium]